MVCECITPNCETTAGLWASFWVHERNNTHGWTDCNGRMDSSLDIASLKPYG